MGYLRVISYTLASEPGTSLRAVGARRVALVKGEQADRPSRRRRRRDSTPDLHRWEL
jgi:hypothetical protein